MVGIIRNEIIFKFILFFKFIYISKNILEILIINPNIYLNSIIFEKYIIYYFSKYYI